MRRSFGLRALGGLAVASAFLAVGVTGAAAQQFHGIAFVKGCSSPTAIGAPYTCAYSILNIVDQGHDPLRVTALTDVVHAASGDVSSGNILGALQLIFNGPVTCVGGSGAGTAASPYVGATSCTIPFGSVVQTAPNAFYTVQAADFNLPNHQLTDGATVNWNNTCTAAGILNCTTLTQGTSAGAATTVQRVASSTTTAIHDAAHQVVTTVDVGTTVHDLVTVAGQPGQLGPTGNVNIDWFLNGDCSGAPAINSGSVGPLVGGQFDATAFAFTVNSAGFRAFRAHYEGDATYLGSDGPCEPLRIVDANIQITPETATNPVGTNHTLTGHVNVNTGSGFANAPDGTEIDFSIVSGPGGFVGPASCTTSGGTGSCTATITSPTPGTTVVRASTAVSVAGITLARATGDGKFGDSADAQKVWQRRDANIQISPPTATNEVRTTHTLTAHVNVDSGSGFANAPDGTAVSFSISGPGTFVGPASCTTSGGTGSCTVVITSSVPGTTVVKASTDVTVAGAVLHRETGDGLPGDSPNAQKTWVDANIQISPLTATNHVGTTHTLTGHVNVNPGTGFVNAPAGTLITFAKAAGPGGFVGPSTCTTVGSSGECTVVISSTTTGTTVINASTDVTVGGVSLHRSTGDGLPGDSANASKTWVAAAIAIAPSATNEVGHPHTFTVTVLQDAGTGSFVPAAGAAVTVTCAAANGGTPSPAGPFTGTTDAAGHFAFTVNSPTTGTDTCHAAATLSVNGSAAFTVETNGSAPNSGDATKRWVNANVQISPQAATNPVGTTHTLTGHVNVDTGDGAGFVNAPAGTVISFSLVNAGGASAVFVGPSSCTTADASGSCTVVISSPTTGTTTIKASTSVGVGGVTLNRSTGDNVAGDSPDATKTWTPVHARIRIAPDATNEVGASHTFTVTLEKDIGTGVFGPAAGEHVDVTLTDANGAAHTAPTGTCTNAGANTDATGRCTITFTSPSAGTVTGHAIASLTVNGVPLTVSTNGVAPNSSDAVKTFVDARIQITPPTAGNPVGTNHTLTGHVDVNDGSGGFVNAPAGTSISFSLTNSGGATATFVGPSSCTTPDASGSCTVVISSPTVGTTTIHASTTLSVAGVSLTRATGDTHAGDGPDATKNWGDVTVRTDVLDDSGNVITSAVVGDVVRDKVYVAPAPGAPASSPTPTGNVVFHRYDSIDCSGTSTDETVALGADGTALSSPFTVPGDLSYRASYGGDANFPARDGACEPLSTTIPCPAGSFNVTIQPNGDAVIVFDQFPAPNDNSYGVNAVGWGTKGHTFNNLVGSDHSGYEITNPSGTTVLDFYIDYISQTTVSAASPSGYASLGPFGGDGKVNTGSLTAADVTWDTSLARDLNALGYFVNGTQTQATLTGTNGANLLSDSPPTLDTISNYTLKTPNPWTGTTTYPENGRTITGWDFHDTYFVTLKAAKLVALGAENPTTHQLNPGWTIGPDAAGLHNSPAKVCPPAPPSTKAKVVASASAKSTTAITSPSFTLKANTSYLVFAFTNSTSGDSATPSSTFAGTPTFNAIGSGSQSFNGKDYDFAWSLTGGASDSTGTITVSFAKQSSQAYLQVVELSGNDTTNPIAQSAYTSGNNTSPYTANLPNAPSAGDYEVVFLTGNEDLGGSAPVATPPMTNLVYAHAGSGSAGTYVADVASQNESFAGGNKHWGTVAVEVRHS